MSDSNIDARKDRADVARFAPRHHRVPPDEATILPVLERLSRGQSDGASHARSAEPVPPAEPIRTQHTFSSSRLPLSATGRHRSRLWPRGGGDGGVRRVVEVEGAAPGRDRYGESAESAKCQASPGKGSGKGPVNGYAADGAHSGDPAASGYGADDAGGKHAVNHDGRRNGASAAGGAEELGHVPGYGGAGIRLCDDRRLQGGRREDIRTD